MQALLFPRAISFDLHVLGMPPAFILSQDQTLNKNLILIIHKFIFLATQIDILLSFQRTFLIFTFFLKCINNISNIFKIVNTFLTFFNFFY